MPERRENRDQRTENGNRKIKNLSLLSGFTLIELAIVLVIVGLIVAGVLTGQTLIRSTQLNSVVKEYYQYKTALGIFRDKYSYLPGDMPNAVKFWGAQAGGTADGIDSTCAALTTAATGTLTCNGNGDSGVTHWLGVSPWWGEPHEVYRAWQHLANAGLVEGSFSGVQGSGGVQHAVIGTNVPGSKFNNGGWTFWDLAGFNAGTASFFPAKYGTTIIFGGQSSNTWTNVAILRAEEAYIIDNKIDDGKPHTGKILSQKNAIQPNCVPASNDIYSISDTTAGCYLLFITGY
jgi:prepilin-type N-terminal cleavage/methylation domain-containing protein